MIHKEQWIWLPESTYPNPNRNILSGFDNKQGIEYIVAEFKKEYVFSKKIISANLRLSGDCTFRLYCNEEFIATGPACVGGDFIGNETIRKNHYSYEKIVAVNSNHLDFFALVKQLPEQICEYSKGHGGFMLSAILTFENGTKTLVCTDDSWYARKNNAYVNATLFDDRKKANDFTFAEIIENIWHTTTAPIPVRTEDDLLCNNSIITLSPFEEKTVILELDKIWAGFLHIKSNSQSTVHIKTEFRELKEKPSTEEAFISDYNEYTGFYMHSAGNITATVKNLSNANANVTVSFTKTHYPVTTEGSVITSDIQLNNVIETCKHTLKICRQTHHLDSPRHCEPMACTGDYYIESLMTLYSFGDMRLAEFDLIRTAYMLERKNGRMFHTTYSLIWVRMLYDVYMATGNTHLLKECLSALNLLLNRFETYIGTNGLIENPPDYMFIDWIYIDEISLHHPPKALGQSCLNMFYYGALDYAQKIFEVLSDERASDCKTKKESLKEAINLHLFDKEKNIYFMGLNTPSPKTDWKWMPYENTEKRYYLKHANVLAAYFGVCDDDTGKELIRKIMCDEIDGECQPYFLHYLLEAIYRLGLKDEYTLKIINKWKLPVEECSKGLVEGFIAPEPTYSFDHSHAWGGTPLYSLPKALTGFEIKKAGMKEITLTPSLLGLDYADIKIPTPYGDIICKLKKDEKPYISYPEEIKINIM